MVSVVLTGRNDEHSPGFRERLVAALDANVGRMKAAGITFEIVWVEWNAVEGRPLLAETLLARYPEAQAVVVPANVHQQVCTRPHMPFLQYFAKNAGLRRAQGRYLLATNSDIVFSDAVIARMAQIFSSAPAYCLYRATRRDLREDVPPDQAADAANWTRLNITTPPFHVEQSGDFLLAAQPVWMALGGFNESVRDSELHVDSQCCVQAVKSGLEIQLLGDVFHLYHPGSWTHLSKQERDDAQARRGRNFNFFEDVPYENPPSWGLADAAVERNGRILSIQTGGKLSPPAGPTGGDYQALAGELQARAGESPGNFCEAFLRACMQLQRQRPPPLRDALPFIKEWLRLKWRSLLAGNPRRPLALYGAGRHTEWLLGLLEPRDKESIVCILDDYAGEGQSLAGIPVVTPGALDRFAIEAIVISSDVYEAVLAANAANWAQGKWPVVRLYEELPKGLYLWDLADG